MSQEVSHKIKDIELRIELMRFLRQKCSFGDVDSPCILIRRKVY